MKIFLLRWYLLKKKNKRKKLDKVVCLHKYIYVHWGRPNLRYNTLYFILMRYLGLLHQPKGEERTTTTTTKFWYLRILVLFYFIEPFYYSTHHMKCVSLSWIYYNTNPDSTTKVTYYFRYLEKDAHTSVRILSTHFSYSKYSLYYIQKTFTKSCKTASYSTWVALTHIFKSFSRL